MKRNNADLIQWINKADNDLVYLLEIIGVEDKSLDTLFERILKLQNYAVEVRYPDKTIFLTDEKVKEAIETAKILRRLLTDKMGLKIDYHTVIDSDLPKT